MDLAKRLTNRNISGFDLDIVLKEIYLEKFQLDTLGDKHRPLAMVAMNKKETYGDGDRLRERIRVFKTYELGKQYEISLLEYFSLPREFVEFINDTAREEAIRIQQLRDKAKRDAERGRAPNLDVDGVGLSPHHPPRS